MAVKKPITVKATVDVEALSDGSVALTIRHPLHQGQWAKFKIKGGGSLIFRAIEAVYANNAGDADAFFDAHGMSDGEAFNGDTWRPA